MKRWCGRFLALPLLVVTSAAWPSRAAEQPVAVVSVKSFDALLSDFQYLMTLAGQGEQAKQLDGLINALTGGQGLAGFDTKRPFGVIAALPKTFGPGQDPPAMLFLPVTKDEEFLNFLTQVNFPATKGEGGLYTVAVPTGDSVYLRFAHKHVFASNKQELLKGEMADPATALTGVHRDNLFAGSFRLGQIPNELKQFAIQAIDMGVEEGRRRAADKPEAYRQGFEAGVKYARDLMVRLIEDGEEVSITANVDQKQGRLAADVSLKAKAGSVLAKQFQAFGAGRSRFGALARDSAAHALVHVKVPEELRKAVRGLLDFAAGQTIAKETDAQKKALAERILKTLEPTLTSDLIDLGAALRGPMADKKYVFVAGAHVREGKKIEQLARDLVKEVPARERGAIKLDHVSHAGVAIHLVQAPERELDAKFKEILGEGNIYFALRDDAAFISVGTHGLDAVKEAIDLSGKTGSATAPVQAELSIARLAPLAPENRDALVAAVQKIFTAQDKDRDRIRLSIQGGDNALRLRLEADSLIVKVGGEMFSRLQGR